MKTCRLSLVAAACAMAMPFFAPPASAACNTSFSETVDVVGVVTFYVDGRSAPQPPPFYVGQDTWIYEESNNVPDLQRGGTHFTSDYTGVEIPGETDPCQESADPDDIWL